MSCLVAGGVLVFWMILVTTGFVPLVLQRKTKTVRTKQRRRKRKKARRRENNIQWLERFSSDCQKTKTTPTNHDRGKQRDEPITITNTYQKLAQSAGKIIRTWRDWFCFCFSLVEIPARVFQANHTKCSNRNHVITFDSHLKSALLFRTMIGSSMREVMALLWKKKMVELFRIQYNWSWGQQSSLSQLSRLRGDIWQACVPENGSLS